MTTTVRIGTDARGVATLTLARAEKHNALSAGMIAEITEAARALGADHVHATVTDASAAVGARRYAALIGPPAWRGGFDAVIDAAGSRSSLDAAAWAAHEGATVVLLGAPGSLRHDFSPHWFREIRLLGSFAYSASEFAEAVTHLRDLVGLERVVTRSYPLRAYRTALADVRARRVLKAVFAPQA